jgi:hypothetical protein
VGRDRQELVPRVDRPAGLAVQSRVVDGQGGTAGQVFGQRHVGRAVAPLRLGRDERHRAQHPSAGVERHGHRRTWAKRAQQAQVPGIPGRRGYHQRIRHLRPEHRPAGPQHLGNRMVAREARREAQQLARPLVVRVRRHLEPAERPVLLDHVDDAPVGQVGDGQAGDVGEGRLVVERRGQERAGLGQEGEAVLGRLGQGPRRLLADDLGPLGLGPPPLADVVHHDDRAQLPPAGVEDRLAVRRNGPRRAPLRRDHQLGVADGLPVERPEERDVLLRHARLAVGQVEVVLLGPPLGREPPLGLAVELAGCAVEEGQGPVLVAGDDPLLEVLEDRLQELALPVQLLPEPLALGDVADQPEDEAAGDGRFFDRAERQLDPDFLAGLPQGRQLDRPARGDDAAAAFGAIAGQAGLVLRPQALGHEHRERAADRLGGGVAEEGLGGRVPEHDPPAVDVADDHGLGDAPEEAADAEIRRPHGRRRSGFAGVRHPSPQLTILRDRERSGERWGADRHCSIGRRAWW